MTLVELTVAMVIGVIVLGAVGGFFIAVTRSSRDVQVSTQALDQAQVALDTMQAQVRNADQISVSPTTGATTLLLRTYTRGGGAASCVGWHYDATTSTLRTKSLADPVGTNASLGATSGWTQLVPNVGKSGTTAIFTLASATNMLTVTFVVAPTGGSSTTLTTSVAPLSPLSTSTAVAGSCAL